MVGPGGLGKGELRVILDAASVDEVRVELNRVRRRVVRVIAEPGVLSGIASDGSVVATATRYTRASGAAKTGWILRSEQYNYVSPPPFKTRAEAIAALRQIGEQSG